MEKLEIQQGEWTYNKAYDSKHEQDVYEISTESNEDFISCWTWSLDEIAENHAIMITDAGTTYNQCGFIPSELKAQKEELLDMLIKTYNRFGSPEKEIHELIQKYKSNEQTNLRTMGICKR